MVEPLPREVRGSVRRTRRIPVQLETLAGSMIGEQDPTTSVGHPPPSEPNQPEPPDVEPQRAFEVGYSDTEINQTHTGPRCEVA